MATPTWQRVQRATGRLSTQAVQRMEQLPAVLAAYAADAAA